MKRRLSPSTRLSDFSQALTFDCTVGVTWTKRLCAIPMRFSSMMSSARTSEIFSFMDGTWSKSNGDEDVVHNLDGSKRLITRSFQNWHTHLPMQLNARDFSDGLPLEEWLDKSIFPTEMKLTKEYASIGALASALEMIKTGSTFACDMYHFPESIVSALNEAGLRGIVCGPQTQWPPREGGDDGSVEEN